MKINGHIIAAVLYTVFSLLATGCAKKYGCLDENAINFDESAWDSDKYADNSCIFAIDREFYINQDDSEFLLDSGHVYYHVCIDGKYIGSDSSSSFVNQYNGDLDDVEGPKFYDTIFYKYQYYFLELYNQDSVLINSYSIQMGGGTGGVRLRVEPD